MDLRVYIKFGCIIGVFIGEGLLSFVGWRFSRGVFLWEGVDGGLNIVLLFKNWSICDCDLFRWVMLKGGVDVLVRDWEVMVILLSRGRKEVFLYSGYLGVVG